MISLLLAAYGAERDAGARWRGLRDELVTILLAGHETTASTLSWTWYLLAAHPEAAAAVRAEAVERARRPDAWASRTWPGCPTPPW